MLLYYILIIVSARSIPLDFIARVRDINILNNQDFVEISPFNRNLSDTIIYYDQHPHSINQHLN